MKNFFIPLFFILLLLSFSASAQKTKSDVDQKESFRQLKATMLTEDRNDFRPVQNFKSQDNNPGDFGETPEVDWLKKFDGSGQDIIQKSVADAAGNIYLIGDFSGTLTFAGTTLTSVGKRDVLFARLDASMNLLWIKQGNCGEFSTCVFYDLLIKDDQILITGYFNGDTFSMDGSSVGLSGLSDALLIKATTNGQIELLKTIGVSGYQYRGLAVAQDDAQNIYLTGTTDGNTSYYHPSFLTMLDAGGNVIWWQEHEIAFSDLAVSEDILYVGGSAYQDGWLGDIFLDPNIYADAFVAKANLDGEYDWAVLGEHVQNPAGDSYMPKIEIGSTGDIFVAGHYRTSVEFGGILLSGFTTDMFILRMNSEGEVVWANSTYAVGKPLTGFGLLENDWPCISGPAYSWAHFDDIDVFVDNNHYAAIYNSSGVVEYAFVVEQETRSIAPSGEGIFDISGSTKLNASIVRYDFGGNDFTLAEGNGNSGTAQLTGLELSEAGAIFSLSNIYGHANYFGASVSVDKESLLLSCQAGAYGDIIWFTIIPGGRSWEDYIETSLKLDTVHNRLFFHGTFRDTLNINSLQFVDPLGGSFIASYEQSGQFLWAKALPENVYIQSLDVDAEGNVYYSTVLEGIAEIEGTTYSPYSSGDALILKYDSQGNFISATQTATDVFFYSLGIATIPGGGYFLTMEPAGDSVFFDNGNSTMVLTPNDGRSVVAKFDDQGNYLWAKSFGYSTMNYGGFYCWPTASVTDDQGNLYLTGTFGDSAMFGNIMLRSPYNRYSQYNAKIDADGNALWANAIQVHRWANNYCEAEIDADGNFYCMGNISDTIHFDNYQYIPEGPSDTYLAKYENNGELAWVKIFGSSSAGNHMLGMAVYEPDNLFVGGGFRDWITDNDWNVFTASSQAGVLVHLGETIIYTGTGKHPDPELSLEVYPNPANDFINIDLKELYLHIEISLTDMNGTKVKALTLQNSGESYTLDLNGFPRGTYLMTITADGKSCTRKIIIQ